jgi:hypothetical protein
LYGSLIAATLSPTLHHPPTLGRPGNTH